MKTRSWAVISVLLVLVILMLPVSCKPRSTPSPSPSPTPVATPTPLPEGTSGRTHTSPTEDTYRNTTYGFSITFPKDWVTDETGESAPIVFIYAPDGVPVVQVFQDPLVEAMSIADYASKIKDDMAEQGIKISSDRATTFNDGTPGYEITFTFSMGGTATSSKLVVAVRGSQAFIVQAFGTTSTFEQNRKVLDGIISSLRLEEPRPFGAARSESVTLVDLDPVTLDPALTRTGLSLRYVLEIFSGLVSFDRNMQLVPDIAERWDTSNGGKTYTFHLRRGVRFHDSAEVTANDFKYSLERSADPATRSQTADTYLGDIVGVKEKLAGTAREIRGVRVVDDYTIEITIDAPKPYFLYKLTYPTAFVVKKANVDAGTTAPGGEWWQQPLGTGPFRLREYQKDNLLILEKNPGYHLEQAGINNVVVRILGGLPMVMYETGEVDVAEVGGADLDRVLDPGNPLNKELITTPGSSVSYLGFNTTKAPFDDIKVRQAFAQAIDRDKMVDLILKSRVQRADGIIPPGFPGYNKDLRGLPFDAGRAKQLIAESTYGDVSRLPPVTLTTSGVGSASEIELALVDMWQQNLGVKVDIRLLDPDDYPFIIRQEKDHMFTTGWSADYPDPENFVDVLFHSGAEENTGEYSSPEVDSLLEKARVEQDPDTRMSLYRQAEQQIVSDAALLPLFFGKTYTLVKPYVKGLPITPISIPTFKYVTLEPH